MNRQAVFFDKDGTLVEDVPYNVDPALIRLNDGARSCLHLLRAAGFRLYIVSNQPGVGKGLFNQRDLVAVWHRIEQLSSVRFDGFFVCPHVPDEGRECDCRKPLAGLLLHAAARHQIDLTRSWMVGDILDDIEAGRRAGTRTIHLDVGNETEWLTGEMRTPDFTAKTLMETAELILTRSSPTPPGNQRQQTNYFLPHA